MADDAHNTSDISEPIDAVAAKEDAETTAARRELKQTTISEKVGGEQGTKTSTQDDQSGSDDDAARGNKPAVGRTTPDLDVADSKGDLRERVASPKKKRAHAELVADGSSTTAGEGSSKPAITAVTQTRTEASEPEKKRHRDSESTRRRSQDGEESGDSSRPSLDKTLAAKGTTNAPKGNSGDKPAVTSQAAFASSGFAKLATTQSGFAMAGSKPSVFGGASASSGSFGSFGGAKAATSTTTSTTPKLTFGGPLGGASPFALNGGTNPKSVFGSTFGSAFGGSALSAPRLSSFAKPGEGLKNDKPARPFGAPESDAEDAEDDDGEDDGDDKEEEAGSDKDEGRESGKDKDESKTLADDKKKMRLQKIKVDDGESGDITLIALRAKLFVMEKAEDGTAAGWKERGAGMLKVNVPSSSVELDEQGHPDASTFDASTFDESDDDDAAAASPKCVRLIMRQDHTLRVILNTIILPGMNFKVTRGLKSSLVLFTAFDDTGKATQMQVKMSDANTTAFMDLTQMIKRQLADV